MIDDDPDLVPLHFRGETDEPIDQRVFIGEMAKILDRDEHTVRRWVKESEQIFEIVNKVPDGKGFLPHDLWPERERHGRRRIFWYRESIDELKEFATRKLERKGWKGSRRSA